MQVRIYVFSVLFFLGALQSHASDTPSTKLISPGVTHTDCIMQYGGVPLTLLTELIGFKKALLTKKFSLSTGVYELFAKLYVCPREVQYLVISKINFYGIHTMHEYYAHTFKKKSLTAHTNSSCAPMIYMFDDRTLAINTGCVAPVQIWSTKKKSMLFQSTYQSHRPTCCLIPSNSLVSLSSTNDRFNIVRKNETGFIDCTTSPIVDQRISIVHFIAHNNTVITTCSSNNLNLYDIEKQAHIKTYINAHDDYISCGTQFSEHCFTTGGYDSVIKLWDVRSTESCTAIPLNNQVAPCTIKPLDDNTLLIGTNKYPALQRIDIRKPQNVLKLEYEKYPIHDIAILQDKSLVLCASQDIDFGYTVDNRCITVRTIQNICAPLAITKSCDDVIAVADLKSNIFLFAPTDKLLYKRDEFELSDAFACLGSYTELTE